LVKFEIKKILTAEISWKRIL